jgi:hypothetical protein
MAFLFRACQKGDSTQGVAIESDQARIPRSVGGYNEDNMMQYNMMQQHQEEANPSCFRVCRGIGFRGRGRGGRENSSKRVVPMDNATFSAEMTAGAHLQQKKSLPSRSPSRKLTPYPGKTGASSLEKLKMLAPPGVGGGGGMTMDRGLGNSFRRSNAKKYDLIKGSILSSSQDSRASSICANSGAKPIKSEKSNGSSSRSKSNSNGDSSGSNSKSRESRSGTGTGGSGSAESGESATHSTCSYDSIDWSKPPSSLLEASMRRVAMNEKKEMVAREKERIKKLKLYPKPLKVFTEMFFRGLLSGNAEWAADAKVVDCFHEEARMMTHDGQMYYGRNGLIKRLNRGMERLLKMLGEHNKGKGKKSKQTLGTDQVLDLNKLQEMGLECCEPVQTEEGTWSVVFNMKKGVIKYSFEDEFVMEGQNIKKLTRRLIR